MNVLAYLEKHDLVDTVLEGLINNPFVTDDHADEVTVALERYNFVINHRAKTRFGQFNPKKKIIEVTSEYFNPANDWEDVKDDHHNTVLHEVAHLVVHVVYEKQSLRRSDSVKAHGAQWRRVMRSFGLNPQRTGSSDILDKVKKHKYAYVCSGCGYEFMRQRKMKSLTGRYHGECGKHTHLTLKVL